MRDTCGQTEINLRHQGRQVSHSRATLLPSQWHVRQLVRLAESEPSCSAKELALRMARQVAQEERAHLPAAQFSVVQLVFQTFQETVDLLLARIIEFQQSRGNRG